MSDASSQQSQSVPVNVYETSDALVVLAPLPGVMPDDIDVSLDGRTLRIRADMRTPAHKEYLVHEWHYGPYQRDVELPEGFGELGEASFGNGQLAVNVKRGAGGKTSIKPSFAGS